MPTQFFTNCFGKQRSFLSNSVANVTEVKTSDQKQGNFLLLAQENALKQAEASKSIKTLENEIEKAKLSGLLVHSQVFVEHQQYLQLWKRALEDVKESSKNLDAETLFVSLEKLRSLSLVDEFGHQDYGEAILSILTAINKLREAVRKENLVLLKKAKDEYSKAREKLETYGNQRDVAAAIMLSGDELEKAEELLTSLVQENNLFAANPNYPKTELLKAIEIRSLEDIELSKKRWKRLNLDLEDKDYLKAVKVANEIVRQNIENVIEDLETSLRKKNAIELKKHLLKAEKTQVKPFILQLYKKFALPALEKFHENAKLIIENFQKKDFKELEKVLVAVEQDVSVHEEVPSMDITEKEKLKTNTQDHSKYLQAIEYVRHHSDVIVSESKSVFRATRFIINAFRTREQNLTTLKTHLEKIIDLLKSFVKDYAGGIRLNDNLPLLNRRSLLQSPKDRLVLSGAVVSSLSVFPQTLESSMNSCRQSIKSFEKSLEQVFEPITAWVKQNSSTSYLDKEKEASLDLSLLEDARNVKKTVVRLVEIAKAENSLTFFETSSSTPKDRSEIENVAVHMKEGVKVLSESDSKNEKATKFVDLCYNRPDSEQFFSDKEKFPYTTLVLKCFSALFPERLMIATRKAAEIQLVELKLFCADEDAKLNSARYSLNKAVAAHSEKDIVKALRDVAQCRGNTDSIAEKAKKELNLIRSKKASCRDALRSAIGKKDEKVLEETLNNAENLNISMSEPLVVSAKQTLECLRFVKTRRNAAIEALQRASISNKVRDIRHTLARAKACRVTDTNPLYKKTLENLNHHRSLNKFAKAKQQKFLNSLKQKENISDNDPINFSKLIVKRGSLSSRRMSNKERNQVSDDKSFLQYLQNETDAINSGDPCSTPDASRLHLLLKYAEIEKKEISKEAFKAAQTAVKLVDKRQEKAKALKQKLTSALKKESFDDMASAIASLDAEPEILDYKLSDNTEELFELLAKAKENFALLNMQKKSNEKDKIHQHITLARKKLKQVMLQDANGIPLKEAVETFKLVCSSVSPRFASESEKQTAAKKTPRAVTLVVPNKQPKEKRFAIPGKKAVGPNQEARFLNTKKLYRSTSLNKGLRNNSAQNGKRLNSARSLSARASSRSVDVNQNKEKSGVPSDKATKQDPKLKSKVSDSSKVADKEVKVKSILLQSTEAKRPLSASENLANENDFFPLPKIAWNEIDKKNTALLRKAEKSLRKKEKEEEKKKKDAEKEEFLNSIKDELLANLGSSLESRDRVELWQAVHEFDRYFGNDNSNRLFVLAKEALQEATFFQYQENLSSAVKERNQEKLEHVLYEIENDSSNYYPKDEEKKTLFLQDISDAKRLVIHLSNLKYYKESVMRMTRSLISEMNSYSSPPDAIKSVMAATYLLLGESENTVKDWNKVHALIGRLGKFSLTRSVVRCSPESVSLSSCRLSSKYLAELDHERVRSISLGASIFFAWAKCMIFEVFSRHGKIPRENKQEQDDFSKSQPASLQTLPSNEFLERLSRSTRYSAPKRLQRENKRGLSKRPRALSAKI